MKKHLIPVLLSLILSNTCFAQKYEVLEMAGYSSELSTVFNMHGFCNRVSFKYSLTKRFSLGVLYEYNAWLPSINSFGIVPELYVGHFYLGADVACMLIHNFTPDIGQYNGFAIKDVPSMVLGLHVAHYHKLSEHILIRDQLGLSYSYLTASSIDRSVSFPAQPLSDRKLVYAYALLGVAYRF